MFTVESITADPETRRNGRDGQKKLRWFSTMDRAEDDDIYVKWM